MGRVTRNGDPLELRSKNFSRESSYEDGLCTVKSEPNFNNSSTDSTVTGAQVNPIKRIFISTLLV